jgi:anti-anti-sigma regulatory factor
LTSILESGHGALVVDLKSIAYISSVGFQALLKASRVTGTLVVAAARGRLFISSSMTA